MSRKQMLVIFCLLAPFSMLWAQSNVSMAQTLVSCIEAQDINELAYNFAPEMEISIQGDGGLLSATQAKSKIHSFLVEQGVKSCSITHNGDRQTSGFCIISLKTNDGSTYRLYSFYRQDDAGKTKIQQFRIDYD